MDNIRVIEDWILVKPEKDQDKQAMKTEGGIYLPPEAQKKAEVVKKAEVIQISKDIPGLLKKEKGEDAEMKYGIGDTVLFYGKTGIPIENGEYMFLKWDGMLAIQVSPVEVKKNEKASN